MVWGDLIQSMSNPVQFFSNLVQLHFVSHGSLWVFVLKPSYFRLLIYLIPLVMCFVMSSSVNWSIEKVSKKFELLRARRWRHWPKLTFSCLAITSSVLNPFRSRWWSYYTIRFTYHGGRRATSSPFRSVSNFMVLLTVSKENALQGVFACARAIFLAYTASAEIRRLHS